MNKPTANYKMSSKLKTHLTMAKFVDADQRSAWKRAMINAEIESRKVVKSTKGEKA